VIAIGAAVRRPSGREEGCSDGAGEADAAERFAMRRRCLRESLLEQVNESLSSATDAEVVGSCTAIRETFEDETAFLQRREELR